MKDDKYKKIAIIAGAGILAVPVIIGGSLEDLTPLKKGVEDKINTVLPNIPIWWDNGNFFDVSKDCIIPNWVGWVGLMGILTLTAFLVWKWKKVWKRQFMYLISKPKVYCICKECGTGIKSELQGDVCRTCEWYKKE